MFVLVSWETELQAIFLEDRAFSVNTISFKESLVKGIHHWHKEASVHSLLMCWKIKLYDSLELYSEDGLEWL